MLLHKLYDCVSLFMDDTLHQWMTDFFAHRKSFKKDKNFRDMFHQVMNEAIEVIDSPGWVLSSKEGENTVHWKSLPNIGKVFKFEGVVNMEAKKLKDHLYDVEQNHEWDKSIIKSDVIQNVDSKTCLVHTILRTWNYADRDFFHLRGWEKINDTYIHSNVSINHQVCPPSSSFIRSENKFNTFIIRPVKEDPSKSQIIWLLQVTLKGWIPNRVSDVAVPYGMLSHVNDIRAITGH